MKREALKEAQFTTLYIYEIDVNGKYLWEMSQYNKQYSPHNYQKATKTFLNLCEKLKSLLAGNEYCEIYICWQGEERDEREQELTIHLNDFKIEELDIYPKTFIRIENKKTKTH